MLQKILSISFVLCAVWAVSAFAVDTRFNGSVPPVFNVVNFGADPSGINDSYQAIVAAQAVAAVSCGVVYYPGGTYKVLSSITPVSCVTHQGVGYNLESVNQTLVSGTILVGDGTKPMFAYHVGTRGGGDPVSAVALGELLNGVTIKDMAIRNVTHGLSFGGLYNSGIANSVFEHLLVRDAAGWGVYCENCSLSEFTDVWVIGSNGTAGTPTGMFYHGASQTHYNHGNSTFRSIKASSYPYGARGVVFQARSNARLNDMQVFRIGSVGSGSVQTQAATTDGLTPSTLTVSDGTKYPVDMPVTVTASAGGLIANQVYFVISRSGNTIQLANRQGGTGLTVSAGVTVRAYGFPPLEVSAYDPSGVIQGSSFIGLDLEGAATTQMLVQNCYCYMDAGFIDGGQGTVNAASVTARGAYGTWRSAKDVSYDADSATYFFTTMMQSRSSDAKPIVQYPPMGLWYDNKSLGPIFNMQSGANGRTGTFASILGANGSSQDNTEQWTYPLVAIGQRVYTWNGTSVSMNTSFAGAGTYTGTVNTTWTLPQLRAAAAGSSYFSNIGMSFCLTNGSTTGGVVLTFAAFAGDNFNRNVAKTSYSLAQYKTLCVIGQWDGSAPFWQVISNDGAV